jgi:hypothetical protein
VGAGFGVLVTACVEDGANGSFVDVASDEPHAANSMEMMKVMVSSFFIVVCSVPSLRGDTRMTMVSFIAPMS